MNFTKPQQQDADLKLVGSTPPLVSRCNLNHMGQFSLVCSFSVRYQLDLEYSD